MMIIFLVTLMIEIGRTSMIESLYTAMYLLLDDSYYYWFDLLILEGRTSRIQQ